MAKIPPEDYAVVYHRYHTLDESLPMIARSYACSRSTVLKAMKKFESQVAAEQGLDDPTVGTTAEAPNGSAGSTAEPPPSTVTTGEGATADDSDHKHPINDATRAKQDAPASREPNPTARLQTAASASLIALPGQGDTPSTKSDQAAEKTARGGKPRLSGTLKLRAKSVGSARAPANQSETAGQDAPPQAQETPAQPPTPSTPALTPGSASADRPNLPEVCQRLFNAAEAVSCDYAAMVADPSADTAERLAQTIHGLRRVIARIEIDKDRQLSRVNRPTASAK